MCGQMSDDISHFLVIKQSDTIRGCLSNKCSAFHSYKPHCKEENCSGVHSGQKLLKM